MTGAGSQKKERKPFWTILLLLHPCWMTEGDIMSLLHIDTVFAFAVWPFRLNQEKRVGGRQLWSNILQRASRSECTLLMDGQREFNI
jgi:hypothetical protein